MENFFQICANGNLARLDGTGSIISKTLYRTFEEAVAAQPEFRKKVTTPKNDHDLHVLADDTDLTFETYKLECKEKS